MELLIFYPLAGLCVLFALGVVVSNSPINSAISLIGMMLGLAGIFVLLQALSILYSSTRVGLGYDHLNSSLEVFLGSMGSFSSLVPKEKLLITPQS